MTQMSEELKRTLGISGDSIQTVIDDTEGLEGYTDPPSEPVEFVLDNIETSVPDLVLTDAKIDYVMARNHTYTILRMTTDALAKALAVAAETEHPRAFESFNSLASTARNLTLDLLNLQKTMKEITRDRPEVQLPNSEPKPETEKPKGTMNILELVKAAIASGEITPMGDLANDD